MKNQIAKILFDIGPKAWRGSLKFVKPDIKLFQSLTSKSGDQSFSEFLLNLQQFDRGSGSNGPQTHNLGLHNDDEDFRAGQVNCSIPYSFVNGEHTLPADNIDSSNEPLKQVSWNMGSLSRAKNHQPNWSRHESDGVQQTKKVLSGWHTENVEKSRHTNSSPLSKKHSAKDNLDNNPKKVDILPSPSSINGDEQKMTFGTDAILKEALPSVTIPLNDSGEGKTPILSESMGSGLEEKNSSQLLLLNNRTEAEEIKRLKSDRRSFGEADEQTETRYTKITKSSKITATRLETNSIQQNQQDGDDWQGNYIDPEQNGQNGNENHDLGATKTLFNTAKKSDGAKQEIKSDDQKSNYTLIKNSSEKTTSQHTDMVESRTNSDKFLSPFYHRQSDSITSGEMNRYLVTEKRPRIVDHLRNDLPAHDNLHTNIEDTVRTPDRVSTKIKRNVRLDKQRMADEMSVKSAKQASKIDMLRNPANEGNAQNRLEIIAPESNRQNSEVGDTKTQILVTNRAKSDVFVEGNATRLKPNQDDHENFRSVAKNTTSNDPSKEISKKENLKQLKLKKSIRFTSNSKVDGHGELSSPYLLKIENQLMNGSGQDSRENEYVKASTLAGNIKNLGLGIRHTENHLPRIPTMGTANNSDYAKGMTVPNVERASYQKDQDSSNSNRPDSLPSVEAVNDNDATDQSPLDARDGIVDKNLKKNIVDLSLVARTGKANTRSLEHVSNFAGVDQTNTSVNSRLSLRVASASVANRELSQIDQTVTAYHNSVRKNGNFIQQENTILELNGKDHVYRIADHNEARAIEKQVLPVRKKVLAKVDSSMVGNIERAKNPNMQLQTKNAVDSEPHANNYVEGASQVGKPILSDVFVDSTQAKTLRNSGHFQHDVTPSRLQILDTPISKEELGNSVDLNTTSRLSNGILGLEPKNIESHNAETDDRFIKPEMKGSDEGAILANDHHIKNNMVYNQDSIKDHRDGPEERLADASIDQISSNEDSPPEDLVSQNQTKYSSGEKQGSISDNNSLSLLNLPNDSTNVDNTIHVQTSGLNPTFPATEVKDRRESSHNRIDSKEATLAQKSGTETRFRRNQINQKLASQPKARPIGGQHENQEPQWLHKKHINKINDLVTEAKSEHTQKMNLVNSDGPMVFTGEAASLTSPIAENRELRNSDRLNSGTIHNTADDVPKTLGRRSVSEHSKYVPRRGEIKGDKIKQGSLKEVVRTSRDSEFGRNALRSEIRDQFDQNRSENFGIDRLLAKDHFKILESRIEPIRFDADLKYDLPNRERSINNGQKNNSNPNHQHVSVQSSREGRQITANSMTDLLENISNDKSEDKSQRYHFKDNDLNNLKGRNYSGKTHNVHLSGVGRVNASRSGVEIDEPPQSAKQMFVERDISTRPQNENNTTMKTEQIQKQFSNNQKNTSKTAGGDKNFTHNQISNLREARPKVVPSSNLSKAAVKFVTESILQETQRFEQSKHSRLVVQLRPSELGTMRLEILRKGSNIKALIHVESERVKIVLDNALSHLKAIVQETNSSITQLGVIVDDRNVPQHFAKKHENKNPKNDNHVAEHNDDTEVDEIKRVESARYVGYNTIEMTV